MILYYILDDLPSLSEREMVADLGRFPLFFGTTLFALEAVGVVSIRTDLIEVQIQHFFCVQIIALENNMATPKSFGGSFGVLNVGMIIIVALYAGMGFLGYLKYGGEALGSVTLNLPETDM